MKKKLIFLGSSVTYGAAAGGYSMCDYIAEETGAEVFKWAVSGTTLTDRDKTSYVSRLRTEAPKADRCDHFICQLSTNDASMKLPLGEVSSSVQAEDFDRNTVTGAMEWIIAFAKAKWNCPVSFYTGTCYESEAYQQMVDILPALQKKWGIGVLDLWNDPEMRTISPEKYKKYMQDPIHPTKEGYQLWWGPKFKAYLAEKTE